MLVPDLPSPALAPMPALAAAASVTSTLKLGTWVLAADRRQPAVVVQEAATVDLLSDGRFELGLGAGAPGSAASAGIRVERLEEAALRARAEIPVPLLVAAGGRRATKLAASVADTIAFSTFSGEHLARQTAWVRDVAGDRCLEFALRFATPGSTAGPPIPEGAPNLLSGPAAGVAEHLLGMREKYGISYAVLDEESARELAPVVASLAA